MDEYDKFWYAVTYLPDEVRHPSYTTYGVSTAGRDFYKSSLKALVGYLKTNGFSESEIILIGLYGY